ncbi:MAG: ABC transporter permease [Micromonosporaceae bacterium]
MSTREPGSDLQQDPDPQPDPQHQQDSVPQPAPDQASDSNAGELGPVKKSGAGRSRARRFTDALVTANTGTVTTLAILLSFLVGALIIVVSDESVLATFPYFFSRPSDAFYAIWNSVGGAYLALFQGALVDIGTLQEALAGQTPWFRVFRPISETLTNAAPLILTGLSFTLAFRAGMINIGGNGQAIMGAIGAALVGFGLHLPPVVHLLAALLAGIIGGGLWGLVPGVLKARTGAHEVITTIMLNYIALNFLVWLVVQPGVQRSGHNNAISEFVDPNAQLWPLAGEYLRVNFGIVVALLAAVAVAWLLRRSTLGFELRTVGSNPDAARTAGMSVGKAYMMAMALAGGLSGLGGASILLGTAHSLTPAVVGEAGFDGITVALLGRGKPLGTVLAGLLFGGLAAASRGMQADADVPIDMVNVLQALIVLFIAAPALVKTVFRLREERKGSLELATAKGW